MATNKFSKELYKTTTFWSEHFLNITIDFRAIWKGCKISYIDGYTRSIHYLLVHKALYTRSRLSYFIPGMSEFCKVCIGQRETIIHAFLQCTRAMDAWYKLEPIFLRITGENLNDNIKIFGVTKNFNKCLFWFSNVMVQIMQRSIWQTRKTYENSNIEHNLWKYFHRKVNVIVNRAFLFQGEHLLEQLRQYIPIRKINGYVLVDFGP
ncbi:MAG: hypothetical protein GY858_03360 [Candidatus Omnitrophica bacterium]|nr:hypothetical protein [Candidatus Omnitrophota bacterium]